MIPPAAGAAMIPPAADAAMIPPAGGAAIIPPAGERGMILVNVLAIVAVAAAAVVVMQAAEAPALDRATRFAAMARARAIARGGEASAIAALRHDTTPDSDDRSDSWARAAQATTPISGGSFALAIDDAQARVNLNAADVAPLETVAAALALPPGTAARIAEFVAAHGPVDTPDDLAAAGVAPPVVAALRPFVTALPGDAPVNVNSAAADLLGILLADQAQARRLVAQRVRAGRLTPDDFAAGGIVVPAGTGFTSDHFTVTTTVTIGGTTQRLVSLLGRRRVDGTSHVVVIARAR